MLRNRSESPVSAHCAERCFRPKEDIQQLIALLRLQPALPPFAATAKHSDRRTHRVRDFSDLLYICTNVRSEEPLDEQWFLIGLCGYIEFSLRAAGIPATNILLDSTVSNQEPAACAGARQQDDMVTDRAEPGYSLSGSWSSSLNR
jgi:hypothetical protein